MARKPNYKRMFMDASNLLKLKKEALPKEEVKIEIPTEFEIEDLEILIEEVKQQISFFKENKGVRLIPPTLKVLFGRLIKVKGDMEKINKSLIKITIVDYETAYQEVMKELAEIEEKLKG